jgi:DNA primase
MARIPDAELDRLKREVSLMRLVEASGIALKQQGIERFKLGCANRTLGYRLPEKNRKAGAEVRGQLQQIGILRQSGHEHFSGSLVIPVINPEGVITEVYGRKLLGNKLRKGTPQHLYLPGPHAGVFNEEALFATDEIILCESLIDALTFWAAGYRNVTASYGTSGFTDDHLAAFHRYGIQRVLIAYDRDEAGNQAAEGIDCFRVQFPKGMDANEYALQVKPAAKSLGLVLRSAQWMGKGDAQGSANVAGGRMPGATQAPDISTGTASDEVIDNETGEILTAPGSSSEQEPSALLAAKETIPEPTTASPQPKPADEIEADISEHEINLAFGDRHYRIRGLQKNLSFEVLKVNVLVRRSEAFHVDSLELYNARQRAAYIKAAGIELGLKEEIIKTDLGKVLLKCEALQEAQIKQTLEPEKQEPALSESEQTAALELLKSPNLMNRIAADFERCGVVGEATNTLVGYLACVSRKLDKPLAVMIQSTSAAGKSTLMDAVLALMPEEERVQYSAMTGQSLFYMGKTNLRPPDLTPWCEIRRSELTLREPARSWQRCCSRDGAIRARTLPALESLGSIEKCNPAGVAA